MNKNNLWWIIPLVFVIGMFTYSLIDNSAERAFMPLVETCLSYETSMDMSIILLQGHCLQDAIRQGNNADFCFALQGTKPNNFEDGILTLYNWEN